MSRRKTTEEFKIEVFEKFGEDYEVLGEYETTKKPVKIKHKPCGYTWCPTANNFLTGKSRCPNCNQKKKISQEEFESRIKNQFNDEFEVIGKFDGVSRHKKTKFKHKPCGYEFELAGNLIFNYLGCRRCSDREIHTTEVVNQLINEKLNGEYELLSECSNNRSPISVRHKECGHEYTTRSVDLIYNNGICPSCYDIRPFKSIGEQKIQKYLDSNNIEFEPQYTFEDCRHINKLRFDFAVFKSNGSLLFLIEFDGKQHFEPIDIFGGEKGFKECKIRDKIKNEYCKNNNITLVRIPYWEEDNIEEILDNQFNMQKKAV